MCVTTAKYVGQMRRTHLPIILTPCPYDPITGQMRRTHLPDMIGSWGHGDRVIGAPYPSACRTHILKFSVAP